MHRRYAPSFRNFLTLELLEQRLTLDGTDPLSVLLQAPDSSNQVAIQFNRPVQGVDLADFTLSHGDDAIDLFYAQLEAISGQEYRLTLPTLVEDGEYYLQLVAEGSGIVAETDPLIALEENGQLEWIRDTLAPHLTFQWTPPEIHQPPAKRIAALGDSQTTEIGNSYVPYLRQHLSQTEYSVDIFAEAGWQVPQVQGLWNSSVKDAGYDVAIFFAGVNDLSSTDRSAEAIFADLSIMFDEALSRNMTVIAVGVSPWSNFTTSNAIKQARTAELNTLIEQYANEHASQVRYIDARAALCSVPELQRLATRYDSGDGLHLSEAGDQRLASLISSAIEELRPGAVHTASVTVSVSEPVNRLSELDFQLLRGTNHHPFTATLLTSTELRLDFEVGHNTSASYTIQWIGTEPITDAYGNVLAGQLDSELLIDRQAPTAQLLLPSDRVSATPVNQVTLQFSEAISGLTIEHFQMMRGTQEVELAEATLLELDPQTYQLNLSDQANADGTYRLVVSDSSSDIVDLAGNRWRQPLIINWVRLVAAPTLSDGVLELSATNQSETVELNVYSDRLEMWINGLPWEHNLANVQSVHLNPLAGQDVLAVEVISQPDWLTDSPGLAWLSIEATSTDTMDILSLYGSDGDDLLSSTPLGLTLSNPVFSLSSAGFASVHAYGASTSATTGNDVANLTDSTGTERLIARPNESQWIAAGYEHWMHGFDSVQATSSGGNDTATLHDSDGNDTYRGTSTAGQLTGPGYNLQVTTFPVVTVNTGAGTDSAELVGSAGVDTFVAQSLSSAFVGPGYRHNLNRLESTTASGNGGADVATFYDSTGIDIAELSPFQGSMTGPGFNNVALQFPRINAFSRFSEDTVTIHGSSGVDTFTGQESSSALVGSNYGLYAYRFRNTIARSNGGNDLARLYDSTANDQFQSTPQSATLVAPTFTLTAEQFPTVYGYARSGNDVATLQGSTGVETYNGHVTYGVLSGSGRQQFAYGFDTVNVVGNGGADLANLYDSSNNDIFQASPVEARLSGPGYQHVTSGFARTNAYARNGFDVAQIEGSIGNDQFSGQVSASFMTSGGVANYAYAFDRVTADGKGGNDVANLYDSVGDDQMVATEQTVTLQSESFSNTSVGFARTNVYARSGFDTATLIGTAAQETLTAHPTSSGLARGGFTVIAFAFDVAVAESGGGADIANLFDSTGDDIFNATSTSATLSGIGYRNTANGFSRVNAYARSGNDVAQLIGSARSETVVVRPDYSYIKMSTYLNYASGFDTVLITGGGGNDSAFMYDSAGNDQFTIGNRNALMITSGMLASLDGFFRINAFASAGNDRATLSDSVGNDQYTGRNNLGTLTSSGFTANLDSFDTVVLAPSIGGINTRDVANLTYTLVVGLGWQ